MILTDIFLKILNMSFTGAVIAVMIMWVRLLYRVLPKKYLCFMWCVVLIRLLCPFTFPELGIGEPIQEPIPSNIMEVSEPYIASDIEVIDNTVNHVLQQNFTPEVGASVNPMQIVMTLGTYLWIAGMIGMLIFTGWKLYQFYKTVRECVPDKNLDKRIYRCAVATPVVTGIVTPKIYLPFSLEEPQLSHVLIHEKMHIRRKDHILKLLFYIALIVHWFNPFVWISYRLLERDMEMACDEAVLEKLGDGEKKDYCESLLDLASSKNHFIGNPVAFGESDVKVRIKNVLNYKKPRFWISMIAVIILIITALSCLSGPKSAVEMTEMTYPLTKEVVEEAFAQVNLPGMITEEEYDSKIRTSIDVRDEENRLIAGIASNGDGDKRGLFITLIPYLHSGSASVVLLEEKWEDLINFATLLYGFTDKNVVYKDFIRTFEHQSIHTEYQYDEEPYYKEKYEWLKSYGDVLCQIEVSVATDGTREISGISFYNTQEYSTVNSELSAKNFLYFVFTSISGRYENYVEATGGKYNPNNRDEMFLESDYSAVYLNNYKDRATENCLQNMENSGYFTLVDYFAAQAGSQVRFENAVLTPGDEVNGDKDVEHYLYTAKLTNEKDGDIKEFTVQGSITVANMLNGWKVTDFMLNDSQALSMYITGYRAGDEAENKMVYVNATNQLYYCTDKDVSEEVIESIEQISIDTPYIGTIQSVVDSTFQPKDDLQANFGTIGAEVVFYGSGIAVNIDGRWIEFVNGDELELSNSAKEDIVVSAGVKEQNKAFAEILWEAYDFGKIDGKEFTFSTEKGHVDGVFALYDVDDDGSVELLLNCTDDSLKRTFAYIWGYQNESAYVELCGGPLMNYYDNGIIEDGWSYKSELSGDFFPYSVYSYDSRIDAYKNYGAVDAWDKKISEVNSEGKSFPNSIDVDEDGIVYYILPSDWDGDYDMEPVDGEEYNKWRNAYLNGVQATKKFPAYELTEDNIMSVLGVARQ